MNVKEKNKDVLNISKIHVLLVNHHTFWIFTLENVLDDHQAVFIMIKLNVYHVKANMFIIQISKNVLSLVAENMLIMEDALNAHYFSN